MKDLINLAKDAPQVFSMFYKDLAQPAVKKVGVALGSVAEFCTLWHLPVQLINEKVKLNMEKRMNEVKDKIDPIPQDKLCEIAPEIGVPILEKLSYTTNDEIADLFTTLLSKAASTDTVDQAHPSFIQLLERISVDEARIIKYLSLQPHIPYITYKLYLKDQEGEKEILKKGTLIPFCVDLTFPENINSYLENLSSTGIIKDKLGYVLLQEEYYNELLSKYNRERSKALHFNPNFHKDSIETQKSYFEITSFGRLFINACTK